MDRQINPPYRRKRQIGTVSNAPQSGRGLLSFFTRVLPPLFKRALPFLKSIFKKVAGNSVVKSTVKDLKNTAINAGIDLATDAIRGEDPEKNLAKRKEEAKHTIARSLQSLKRKRGSSRSWGSGVQEGEAENWDNWEEGEEEEEEEIEEPQRASSSRPSSAKKAKKKKKVNTFGEVRRKVKTKSKIRAGKRFFRN